ncbi:MAG: phospho-sugar mutase [Velocimicrobium sp.]
MDYKEKYEDWCNNQYFDEETRGELKNIAENDEEIKDRFYRDLEFGTGGLRGVIGAGTNRMNPYTVRKATQGLANFIIKEGKQNMGVAIAYDSRHFSPEFSDEAALCLNANGIKTYRFESLRPTPELSFAVRKLGCCAGIVVTASHNPPEYNGYKVYWEDGAQVTAPKDTQIIEKVSEVTNFSMVKTMKKSDAIAKNLYHSIGEEIDDAYIGELHKLVLSKDAIQSVANDLTIVYTPLHGTGNIPVRRILKELGFEKVYVVKEQELPDGDFPTVSYPNPEDKNAFRLALSLAEEVKADVVLATDPDADRLGVYARNSETGEYETFTGNMSGLLICEYELERKLELGILPKNGAIVSTIVTTNMAFAVAKEYGMQLIEVLTGFKYIGEQIKLFEETGSNEYIFGLEESYGCLIGTHARDKDAVVAVMALCEAAAYYKNKGITLWEQMLHIYEKYGFYKESLMTITLKGMDGANQIKQMMNEMREHPMTKAAGLNVRKVRDYLKPEETKLPSSNVLYFELEDDAWFCVRPSGTEPKIKFYFGVKGNSMEDAKKKAEELEAAVRCEVEK